MRWLAFAIVGAAACGSPDAALRPQPSAEEIAAGGAAYRANGCAACHGVEGRGDGHLADAISPRPRDFTDATAFTTARTVDAIAAVIATGIPSRPIPMPAFGHLDDLARRRMALWILSRASSSDDAATKEQR